MEELQSVRLVLMHYKVRTGEVTQMWNLYLPEATDDILSQTSHKNSSIETRTYVRDKIILINRILK